MSKKVSYARISQQPFLWLHCYEHHFYTLWGRNSQLVPNSRGEKYFYKPHLVFENRLIRSWKLLHMSKKGQLCKNPTTISLITLLWTPFLHPSSKKTCGWSQIQKEKNIFLRPHLFFENRLIRRWNLLHMSIKGQLCKNLTTPISSISLLWPPFLHPMS